MPAQPRGGTPLAELTELDNTLQELGIDPQSISLFNRMAILLYANDPAALRMLVKTLQDGTAAAGNAGSSTAATSTTNANALPGQSQQPAGQTQVPTSVGQIETPPPPQQPSQSVLSPSDATTQNGAAVQPPVPQANPFSAGFADAQATLAVSSQSQFASYQQGRSSGQLLNVTA